MSYQAANNTAITRGLMQLIADRDTILQQGTEKAGDDALEYLIRGHEVQHNGKAHRHIEENDTLGYCVLHDGKVVKAVSHMGGEIQPWGDVLETIREIALDYPTGWVIVVASDMSNDWYRIDWEIDFLNYAADRVLLNWQDYFKTA